MPVKKYYLPDFIIIGANKAGTTSVASYLNAHPEIHMSEVKEPMFFTASPHGKSADKRSATLSSPYFAVTLDEYSALFEKHAVGARLFGEASTSYLANPHQSSQLMGKIVPDVKIIAIVREPAGRALSAYKFCVGNGLEARSFSEIVENASGELTITGNHGVKEYVRNGLYAQLLKPYYDLFEEDQILLLLYDGLKRDPSAFMRKIYEFLGVRAVPNQDYSAQLNTAEGNLKGKRVEIKEEDVIKLKELFRDEMEELKRLVDIDLSSWE